MQKLPVTERWLHYEISTFEYLIQLNLLSGRSFNNLSQYPIFPWILTDYTSKTINLKDPSVYRDLSKPVGALNDDRFDGFKERYDCMKEAEGMEGSLPSFLYGTHYSTPGYTLYYLVRTEPFTLFHIDLQAGCFDEYNRLFNSVEAAWQSSYSNPGDVKELTPEWFCLPEFLVNSSHFPLNDTDVIRLQLFSYRRKLLVMWFYHLGQTMIRKSSLRSNAKLLKVNMFPPIFTTGLT